MPDIFIDHEDQKQPTPKPETVPAAPVHPDAHALDSVNKLLTSKHHNMGFLSYYAVHPKGITFVNQEPDEDILLFLRRHFITNVPWIIATLLLFIIPPLIFGITQVLPIAIFSLPSGLIISLTILYYLVCLSYAFDKFISWFYNIGIVTQKRIIDLDSTNILSHNTATANFNEIVDVKVTQRGFFQSLFDFGDIHIQTEAIHANFEFDKSPKPNVVSDLISDLRVAEKGGSHEHS